MKLALEALEYEANKGNDNAYQRERDALRTAIEAAEKQEPVWDASAPIVMTPHPAFEKQPAAQRQPLTDEQIDAVCAPLGFAQLSPREVARAIEAAHGIKEKNA